MNLKEYAINGVVCFIERVVVPISQFRINEKSKSVGEFLLEQNEKEEKLKEEKPLLWAAKKIGKGTIIGILGGLMH